MSYHRFAGHVIDVNVFVCDALSVISGLLLNHTVVRIAAFVWMTWATKKNARNFLASMFSTRSASPIGPNKAATRVPCAAQQLRKNKVLCKNPNCKINK